MTVRCRWPTLAVGCWLLLAGIAQAGAAVTVDVDGLSPSHEVAARALVEQAAAHLTPELVAHLPPLTLTFADDLPAHVHGRLRRGRIQLARHLLDDAWTVPPPALAALLHELGHVLDRRLTLSRDERLLDLAGWQVRPRRFGLRNARNPMRDRSPDRYELASPREFVAVNFEYFLLDPDYACRRPALYRHLRQRLGIAGAGGQRHCAEAAPFVVPARDPALEALDPARVHAVEYLLAEPAGTVASRWGHSMLRLVVCAPDTPPGPGCRLDLEHHRVLSFRAFVDDVQISNWRGLTGRYPSRLFVLPMSQVIDEYTRVELRALRSVPLRLSAADIAGLLEQAAQLHWSYDGRYTFLGNNCASEIFKLLHDGVPRLAGEPLAAITPTGLLRRLERAGIARLPALPEDEAVRLGYRFPSADQHYDELFAVARQELDLPAADVAAWLSLTPVQRRPWLDSGDLRATAALLVLEQAAWRRAELRARDRIKRRLLARDADAGDGRQQFDDVRAIEAVLVRPASLLGVVAGGDAGYGLPVGAEIAVARERATVLAGDWHARGEQLRQAARRLLPPAASRQLDEIDGNIDIIAVRLRQLAGDGRAGRAAGSRTQLPTPGRWLEIP